MKVSVVGTGYVGLVSGTCFAELGHYVTCIDINPKKVEMLQAGKSPIYEPGLNDLLARNIKAKRLLFSTTYDSVGESQIIFLAVQTPSADDGRANMEYLKSAAKSTAENLSDDGIVVIKSTVPVGTAEMIKKWIAEHTTKKFHVVNNPEFLKEGSAIEDFMRPDRVVIGHQDDFAAGEMERLYAPLVRQGNPIYKMSNLSAEMTKYAANCFLAAKISFINEIANLCDATGADIEEVRKGITSDVRIGHHFLYPGPGYGGSCFPKDVKALIATAKDHSLDLKIVEAAEAVNSTQKTLMVDKIKHHFKGDLAGKTFSFWGVAFKPNTDDVREAPAIYMARELINAGATVKFFDTVAADNFMEYMGDMKGKLVHVEHPYDALEGSSGLVIVTEWREFKVLEVELLKERMREPIIFDARNIYNSQFIVDQGIGYYAIGKNIPAQS